MLNSVLPFCVTCTPECLLVVSVTRTKLKMMNKKSGTILADSNSVCKPIKSRKIIFKKLKFFMCGD